MAKAHAVNIPVNSKVDHNSWGGAIILAFLATAGLFYVNIMPALIDSLISGLGFSAKTAGYVGSANTFGAALGALSMVFLVRHINWRLCGTVFLLALISIDLFSATLQEAIILITVRFIHGLFGGLLVGLAFALITRTSKPERVFGVLLALQFGFGGLAVMLVPYTVEQYGHQVSFWCLAGFSLITLVLKSLLAQSPEKTPSTETAEAADALDDKETVKTDATSTEKPVKSKSYNAALILTLISIVLFQATNMAIGAYLIGLGKAYGLSSQFSSSIVGLSYWVGALGAVLVSFIGLKYGRFKPLTIAFVITLIGFLLFHYSDQKSMYIIANFGTAATWAFVIPYLFGICSELDISGRMAALAGFFSKIGLTLGPITGAWLIGEDGNYTLLINGTFIGLFVSMIAVQVALWVYHNKQKIMAKQASMTAE